MVEGRTDPLEASGMARFRLLAVPEIVAACAERHQPDNTTTNKGRRIDFMDQG